MDNLIRLTQSILLYLVLRDLMPQLVNAIIKAVQEVKRKRVMRDTLRKNLKKMEDEQNED